MEPSGFKEIVEVLQTGGPWSLLVVMGYITHRIYSAREADRAKYDDEKQKLNDRLIAMSEKQNEIFEKASENQTLLLESLERRRRGS